MNSGNIVNLSSHQGENTSSGVMPQTKRLRLEGFLHTFYDLPYDWMVAIGRKVAVQLDKSKMDLDGAEFSDTDYSDCVVRGIDAFADEKTRELRKNGDSCK